MSDGTGEIAKAVAGIMAELESLPKDGHNAFSNYEFTTEAMIANTLRPMMAKAGLALVPFNSEITNSQSDAGKRGEMQRVTISGQYKLIHTSGESLNVVVPGEGMDSLDKSTAKALTQSYKYALIQIFCAGRGEDGDTGKGYEQPSSTSVKPTSENQALRESNRQEPQLDTYVFTFGRYKGESIHNVDVDYLKWLLENTENQIKDPDKKTFIIKNKKMMDIILIELNRRAQNAMVSSEDTPF